MATPMTTDATKMTRRTIGYCRYTASPEDLTAVTNGNAIGPTSALGVWI